MERMVGKKEAEVREISKEWELGRSATINNQVV